MSCWIMLISYIQSMILSHFSLHKFGLPSYPKANLGRSPHRNVLLLIEAEYSVLICCFKLQGLKSEEAHAIAPQIMQKSKYSVIPHWLPSITKIKN